MSDIVIMSIGQFAGVAAGFFAGRFFEKAVLAHYLKEHAVQIPKEIFEELKEENKNNDNECDG